MLGGAARSALEVRRLQIIGNCPVAFRVRGGSQALLSSGRSWQHSGLLTRGFRGNRTFLLGCCWGVGGRRRDGQFGQAAVAGIEPASGRLTVAFPYQHGTHRIASVCLRRSCTLFERPPDVLLHELDCPVIRLNVQANCLSLQRKPNECSDASRRCSEFGRHEKTESARRESNPHIRHGKAVGCRYITGAEKCLSSFDDPP